MITFRLSFGINSGFALGAAFMLQNALAQQTISPDQPFKLDIIVGAVQGTQSTFKGILLQSQAGAYVGFEASKGGWFASNRNGLGYRLVDTPPFTLGVSANYMLGRAARYDKRYTGLGDVSGTLAAYAYAEWRPIQDAVTVYGNVMRSARSANGTLATAGVTLGLPVVGRLAAFADLSAQWGDAAYANTYYGVNAAQAATSGYAPYNASSGLLGTEMMAGLYYPINDQWSVVGYGGRSQRRGSVALSPMVGQAAQPMAGLLLKYKWR